MMAKFMIGVLYMIGFILEGHSVLGVYYGKQIGSLRTYAHRVTGTLYAADSKTLFITGFNYDGRGPDAFMWMGNTNNPSGQGTIIPVDGSPAQPEAVLEAYSNAVVRLDLPDGKTLADYKWLSIWCRRFGANFGDILIPEGSTPVPVSLGTLGFTPYRVHNVFADDVIVLNNRQIKLVNLDYDGNGPDAYYWAGTGGTPSNQGFSLADESRGGSTQPLPRGTPLNDATVTITIPEERGDIFSIGHLGLWCYAFRQDFGHVDIPPAGVDLSSVPRYEVVAAPTQPPNPENCKVLLDDTYQVKWSVSGTNIQVSLSARINPGTYMAFGLSGSNERTQMFQSDVTVTWLDAESGTTPNAVDYYLSAYQQCVIGSGSGACTDELSNPRGTNDVTLIDSTNNNGIITITYERPLSTSDTNTDKVIPTNQAVYIAWAIGPINPSGLAAKHRTVPTSDVLINFGQTGETCPAFTVGVKEKLPAWEIPAIVGDERKTEFQLDIGQAGGEQGYEGITGSPGWGITWYVDNLMIPIISLKRGVTYTFTVNGGDDANNQARYHPFYITNDPEGGYFQKTTQERQGIAIYAGPTSGSLCEWRSSGSQNPDDFTTFEQYRDTTLQRVCDPPMQSSLMTWTPDANTPNLVFYQCYTHKFLGWKIYIVDGDQPVPEPTPEPTQKPPMPKTTAKAGEQATKSPPMPNTTNRDSGSPGNPDVGSPGKPGGGRDPDPNRGSLDEQIEATRGPHTTAGAYIAIGSKMVVLALIAIAMV